MHRELFDHIDIPVEQTHVPDGMAGDIPAECDSYEQRILDAGGIDLQILGIGSDGHIGFNEPISSLASRTRIKTLTPTTRGDNARFFGEDEEVPHHAITMGIGTILDANTLVMLAFGSSKAEAVAGMVEGPVSATNPGSALHLHPKSHVFLDEQAASSLQRREYYHWVYDRKPAWQTLHGS
jgi:glucosamine-6-phosphate deaminase